jgi:hypothetical protein
MYVHIALLFLHRTAAEVRQQPKYYSLHTPLIINTPSNGYSVSDQQLIYNIERDSDETQYSNKLLPIKSKETPGLVWTDSEGSSTLMLTDLT